jgi:3-isopropylmalate/(R)-2-methylmalate dehydratase small subunit
MKITGKVHKYGDNVDTDAIIAARYLSLTTKEELAKHCFEDLDKEFIKKVKPGDIVLAGTNFGCGSSREHAPMSLQGCGVAAVIAKTYGRIFYHNSINTGFPVLECIDASNNVKDGDTIEIDFATGTIKNLTRNETYQSQPVPDFIQGIIKCGGLLEYFKSLDGKL